MEEISSADWNFLPVSADTCNVEPSLSPEESSCVCPTLTRQDHQCLLRAVGPRPPLARTPSTADSFGLQNGSQSLCLDTESLVLHPGLQREAHSCQEPLRGETESRDQAEKEAQ